MLKILGLFLGLSMSLTTFAADNQVTYYYHNFATCKGKIDGVGVSLKFFEKIILGDRETATGEGLLAQTLTLPADAERGANDPEELAMMNVLKIKTAKNARLVEIAPALDQNDLFASVAIPMNQKFPLQIFAIPFGKVWGNFECTSEN